jgi:hypothetical protein
MSRTNDVGTQPFDEEPELDYPVDHERTTRQHAGESLKNGANAPGLAGLAVAVGAAWLVYAHRRVRDAELRWRATHSDDPAPPPSS